MSFFSILARNCNLKILTPQKLRGQIHKIATIVLVSGPNFIGWMYIWIGSFDFGTKQDSCPKRFMQWFGLSKKSHLSNCYQFLSSMARIYLQWKFLIVNFYIYITISTFTSICPCLCSSHFTLDFGLVINSQHVQI